MRWLVLALFFVLGPGITPGMAQSQRTIIVMDGSGSMWGQIEGRAKLEIARETVGAVLAQIPAEQEIGLIAYGHREKGNCGDIELMVPPAAGTGAAISQAVNDMRFLGKTPLSDAVRQAAEALHYTEDAATVVLVTDGLETCNADPCALANELEQAGLNFTAHVIGLGLSQTESAQVSCLASGTGGRYFDAADADDLSGALLESVASAPVQETPPTQRTYFPGAAMMPEIGISPTGQTTGAPDSSLSSRPGRTKSYQTRSSRSSAALLAACRSVVVTPRSFSVVSADAKRVRCSPKSSCSSASSSVRPGRGRRSSTCWRSTTSTVASTPTP